MASNAVTGRIGKAQDMEGWWWAKCDTVGAYTQGRSREDALLMLADCIEVLSDNPIKITVTEVGPTDGDEITVRVECNNPDELEAVVRQRQTVTWARAIRSGGAC